MERMNVGKTTYSMCCINTRVNNVGADASAGAAVVNVARHTVGPMGNTSYAPRGIGLRNIVVDSRDGIHFNVVDLGELVFLSPR